MIKTKFIMPKTYFYSLAPNGSTVAQKDKHGTLREVRSSPLSVQVFKKDKSFDGLPPKVKSYILSQDQDMFGFKVMNTDNCQFEYQPFTSYENPLTDELDLFFKKEQIRIKEVINMEYKYIDDETVGCYVTWDSRKQKKKK